MRAKSSEELVYLPVNGGGTYQEVDFKEYRCHAALGIGRETKSFR